jgi:hypothetical protein
VLRRGLGLRSRGLGSRGLGSLRRWRRELRRSKSLRLSHQGLGLGLRLRLSMGAARRHPLSLRRCLGRGLCHGLRTGGRLGLRGSLSRQLLSTGRLGWPRILGLRGQSVGDGCRLGGNLRLRREPGLGRSLGLRSDLVW